MSWRRPLLVSVVLALGGASLPAATALAVSQRGHVFSFSYGQKGKGEGQFSGPSGIAVNDSTGDVYVADHKNKRLVRLEPVLNEEAELVGERYAAAAEIPSPSSVAVDNVVEGPDPSRGDVYVVGSGGNAIYKLTAEGAPIGQPLRKFTPPETGVKEKFEAIEGIAVDRAGTLFVYQEDGTIYEFNDAVSNEYVSSTSTRQAELGAPGFALDAEDNLFVGLQGEGGVPVVAKLEGLTDDLLIAELDGEDTTAVAVNTADVPSNAVDELNDVYVANVGEVSGEPRSAIAQFAPEVEGEPGEPIERFGQSILAEAAGVAVDDETGAVYVTDAASDDVDVFELEPHGPPTIEDVSAQPLPPAANARRLSAQIDPTGSETSYHFEYGTSSCAATPSPCTASAPADLGGGFGDKEVALELRDLAPGTYHYRVVAENSFAEGPSDAVYSPERTFTIFQLASGLPDGRAWEMVSPPDKHGASIEALTREGGLVLASEDGAAFAYVANGAISEEAQGNRSPEMQQVIATRGLQQWSSQDVATPQTSALGTSPGAEYRFFSSDLSLALVEPFGVEPPLAPGVTGEMTYLRDDPPIEPAASEQTSYEEAKANSAFLAPGFLALINEASAPEAATHGSTEFLGATPDLSDILLKSTVSLTGHTSGPGLYEWTGDKLRFVSELPSGTPSPEAALGYQHNQARTISSNGARVIWTESEESPGHLYMRDTATGKTVQLDKAQPPIAEPPGSAVFQTANSEGSRVFFTDDQVLTKGASASPGEQPNSDLYECEMVEEGHELGCALRDLTIPLHAGEHAAVQGFLLGSSEDGASLYLVAHGVLASNENGAGATAVAGKDNVYGLHYDGERWTTTFIATLSGEDSPDWDEPELTKSGETSTVIPGDTAFQTARVSPNGRYLSFMSQESLTGYDNEDVSSEHPGERRDEEVYLYDSQTDGLTCVSCDPTGARPVGVLDEGNSGEGAGLVVDRREIWANFEHPSEGHWLAGSIPGWTSQNINSALFQSRYLSNEGRLFFDSADALVPDLAMPTREEDVAGTVQRVGVENVYEYEPAGTGGCEGSGGGCVALISSGTSDKESAFLEASPSGDDAFFLTASQLSPQDNDGSFDIYDAHVCTASSPCLPAAQSPPRPCMGAEECQSASGPGQAPIGASGTAAFSGPGNVTGSPQPKQEVKGVTTSSPPLTRAQKLAAALKACRKQHPHSKRRREACEAHARKLYGPRKPAGRTSRSSSPDSTRGRR